MYEGSHCRQLGVEVLPAATGDRRPCPRPLALDAFAQFDESGFLEDSEVTAKVSVGEADQAFQVGEVGATGLGEYDEDAESVRLVDEFVKARSRVRLGSRHASRRSRS
jgi:hypothetical protein